MSYRYGATEDDWNFFSLVLGQQKNLLPVVSNPNAEISPNSDIKSLGKVPSLYNKDRKVCGILDWTNKLAKESEIRRWIKEDDYGICLQTREIRALDIDIDDRDFVAGILNFFQSFFKCNVPVRFRKNSAKILVPFIFTDDLAKTTIKTEKGIIELLGDGQQFIAAGTHSSGCRYEWLNMDALPELTEQGLVTFITGLAEKFVIESPVESHSRKPKSSTVVKYDEISEKLKKRSNLGVGKNGEIFIACPWKDEHTLDSGISETAYFPAGGRGYEVGHFKCLHAHCAGRTDGDFIEALRLYEDEFDDLTKQEKTPEPAPIKFQRLKSGEIKSTIDNVCLALENPEFCGWKIAHDMFTDEDMRQPFNKDMEWQSVTDNDYTRLQRRLERDKRFQPIAFQTLIRSVAQIAGDNSFDAAKLWLDNIVWDGVPRVDTFCIDILGIKECEYGKAVSQYMWSALAGRTLLPGVKADMMIIFQGDEGLFKSSVISSLVPDEQFFISFRFDEDEKDLARKMRGKQVAEIPELRGLHTKEIEGIKDFVVRQTEEWIPKFKEKRISYPRRVLFFGTTNDISFLSNEGQNRRFLPVKVGNVDLGKLKQDRLQLWAEGAELYKRNGVMWKEAERLARFVHDEFKNEDAWDTRIIDWINEVDSFTGVAPIEKGYVRLEEVMRHALGIELRNIRSGETRRVSGSLRRLGFTRKNMRVKGVPSWVWVIG